MIFLNNRAFIRVDGNSEIGLGHLVRGIAIAHMIKNEFNVSFFCKEIPDTIFKEILSEGFGCLKIINEDEFFEKLSKSTLAILDGYHFDIDYQKRIKNTKAFLVCIDDLHDKEFVADLIINHAPGIYPSDYKKNSKTILALGLDFAILRPTFLNQARTKRKIEKIESVLICFGGSDPRDLTKRVLKEVIQFTQFKKIVIITGAAYQYHGSLVDMIESDSRIDHRKAINEQFMLESFLEAEIAIVPASGILFEAIAAGCIAISGSYLENQRDIFQGFLSAHAIENTIEFTDTEDALNRVLSRKLPYLSQIIDGKSGERILQKINYLIK